jgi:hypothetical protein
VTIPKWVTSSKLTITSTLYDYLTLVNIVYVCTVTVIGSKSLQYPTNIDDHRRVTRLYDMTKPGSSAVHRVAVRLSTFWPARPAAWFSQAKAQFELVAFTRQRTKFNYAVSQLNQQQVSEIEDIITSPPEHEHYDRLKGELVRRLSTSREQRVRQLHSHWEMGDRKPSQFLQHLKRLVPDVPDDFLRTFCASLLPPHVQAILVAQNEGVLDPAIHLADKICEFTPRRTTASITPETPDNTSVLLDRIEELVRQVTSLRASQTHSHSQSKNRHRSQYRFHRSTPDYSPTNHDICWYHWNYGDEARKRT